MLAFDILKRIMVKSYRKQTTASKQKEETVHDGKRALARAVLRLIYAGSPFLFSLIWLRESQAGESGCLQGKGLGCHRLVFPAVAGVSRSCAFPDRRFSMLIFVRWLASVHLLIVVL